MSEIIIGIDPGMNGGIVLNIGLENEDGRTIFPLAGHTETDIASWLELMTKAFDAPGRKYFGFLEQSSPMPKQGVSSTFKFGQGYGFLRGLLIAFKIPFETVRPAKWQRALGCLSHGDKNVTKAKAQELFPGIKVTHAIADALLIAEYGRRMRLGTPGIRDGERSLRETRTGESEG